MACYVFPGYPIFLHRAAEELGIPPRPLASSQITMLAPLANLCSQVDPGNPAGAASILLRANEFRDQLRVALRAAELMLAEVEAACAPAVPGPVAAVESTPPPAARGQRGSRR